MLVLPKRDLNDSFWAESLVIPKLKSIFENVADYNPKEVENAYISEEKDWIFTTAKIHVILNGYKTTFTIIWDALEAMKGLLDIREGSCYV